MTFMSASMSHFWIGSLSRIQVSLGLRYFDPNPMVRFGLGVYSGVNPCLFGAFARQNGHCILQKSQSTSLLTSIDKPKYPPLFTRWIPAAPEISLRSKRCRRFARQGLSRSFPPNSIDKRISALEQASDSGTTWRGLPYKNPPPPLIPQD
jgi:hypothetical protein